MPEVVKDAVLGLVQGLTEFLPVSSSGHLVVIPALLEWEEPSLGFDLLLHLATLLAVVVYFRLDLWGVARSLAGKGADPREGRRLAGLLVLGTVPAALAGLLLEDQFERLFEKPLWVCAFWGVTAVGLVVTELGTRGKPHGNAVDVRVALIVGAAQAVAIIPGISRAGATIAAGLWCGLDRTEAARFSFLLSIPVIAGAGLTIVPDITSGALDLDAGVVAGVVVAAVSGYAAVAGLLRLIRTRTLYPFAVYLAFMAPSAALFL